MRIYAANLDKNLAFQKINHEKWVNFADLRQIKCIFTQPIAKKGVGFANFRQSKCIFTREKARVLTISGDIIEYVYNK